MMEWNEVLQAEFDRLRQAEMHGSLTAQEQARLNELTRILESEEEKLLRQPMERLRAEQDMLRQRLAEAQIENEALSRLISQLERFSSNLESARRAEYLE